jgi:hypothetical protein
MRRKSEILDAIDSIQASYERLKEYASAQVAGEPLPFEAVEIQNSDGISNRMARLSGEIFALRWVLHDLPKD